MLRMMYRHISTDTEDGTVQFLIFLKGISRSVIVIKLIIYIFFKIFSDRSTRKQKNAQNVNYCLLLNLVFYHKNKKQSMRWEVLSFVYFQIPKNKTKITNNNYIISNVVI